jgi:hypothetical protein
MSRNGASVKMSSSACSLRISKCLSSRLDAQSLPPLTPLSTLTPTKSLQLLLACFYRLLTISGQKSPKKWQAQKFPLNWPKSLANKSAHGKNFSGVFFDVFCQPEFESKVRITKSFLVPEISNCRALLVCDCTPMHCWLLEYQAHHKLLSRFS